MGGGKHGQECRNVIECFTSKLPLFFEHLFLPKSRTSESHIVVIWTLLSDICESNFRTQGTNHYLCLDHHHHWNVFQAVEPCLPQIQLGEVSPASQHKSLRGKTEHKIMKHTTVEIQKENAEKNLWAKSETVEQEVSERAKYKERTKMQWNNLPAQKSSS